jgi:hypothetical protein
MQCADWPLSSGRALPVTISSNASGHGLGEIATEDRLWFSGMGADRVAIAHINVGAAVKNIVKSPQSPPERGHV